MPVLILGAIGLFVAAALTMLPAGRRPALAGLDTPALIALAACLVGAAAAAHATLTNTAADARAPWQVPYGSLALHLDAVAGLFLLPIFVLGGLGVIYGREYLARSGADGIEGERREDGAPWAWYYAFVASMAVVVLASNAVLFLVAWEAMSVAAFFLITHDDRDAAVRDAGWIFLIATHIGTAFLIAMFAVLARGVDTLDFDQLQGAAQGGPFAGAVVLLALIGFGTKAGLAPAHVWLPFAHPAAPSHVSALMSGAMLKVGIYGLVRTLTLIPDVPTWTGLAVLGVGLVSSVYAVLLALAQHDLKRLLAFSSVEHIGIICAGLGVGLLGRAYDAPVVATLGFAGAFVHVINHALFKGLLFLGAGAVQRATGTRELERLGGLLQQLPMTGAAFLVGSAAIVAVPPFNGFVGEFLIYSAALHGAGSADRGFAAALLVAIGALALTGGLAVAAFTKVVGVVFLGIPRSEAAMVQHAPGPAMRWSMFVLAAACAGLGLAPPALLRLVRHATAEVSGLSLVESSAATAAVSAPLAQVSLVGGVLVVLVTGLTIVRARLGAGMASGPTWGTAYLAPTPRMQYTASSFTAPLTILFRRVLRMETEGATLGGYFPGRARYETRARGIIREPLFERFFGAVAQTAVWFRWLQHGRIQLYLVNIAATLMALIIWKLGV